MMMTKRQRHIRVTYPKHRGSRVGHGTLGWALGPGMLGRQETHSTSTRSARQTGFAYRDWTSARPLTVAPPTRAESPMGRGPAAPIPKEIAWPSQTAPSRRAWRACTSSGGKYLFGTVDLKRRYAIPA